MSKDEYYLSIAMAVMARSTCLRKKYGAIIVKNDRIVSTGYNGSPRGEENCCDAGICYREAHNMPRDSDALKHGFQYGSCVAVHAEQNAIIKASPEDMEGAALYLACNVDPDPVPCNICDRMIRNAGIKKLITKTGTKNYEI